MAGEREQEVTMTSETEAREIAEIRKIICECDPDGPHSADCEYETAAILAYGDRRAGEIGDGASAIDVRDGVLTIAYNSDEQAQRAFDIVSTLPERTEP